MEITIEKVIEFSSNHKDEKREKLNSVHFDMSGFVVATDSHRLIATKNLFDIKKAGKTFSNKDIENMNEIELEFPKWQQVIPNKSCHKINIRIPSWFKELSNITEQATIVLDYNDENAPFFKVAKVVDEYSLGLNAKYLAAFAGETVNIIITDALSPTVILSFESEINARTNLLKEEILKEPWFALIMPIQMDEENNNQKVYV